PDWKFKYGNLLPRINQITTELEPYARARDYFMEACVRNNELLSLVAGLNSWIESYDNNGAIGFNTRLNENTQRLEGFYKNYYPKVDQAVFAGLMELYAKQCKPEWGGDYLKNEAAPYKDFSGYAQFLYENSVFPNPEKMRALLKENPEKIASTLKNDPAYRLYKGLNALFVEKVQPKLQELTPNLNLLQRQYMAAQMVVFKEKRFFPDANSTLRLTYGPVRGYEPRDAVHYHFQSFLDGVMEKYIPGDYEFDVPQRLIDLYKNKDFGQYATPDGKMPVAFLGANHTTGGNSGSPGIDAYGNLIGLNFDRVWEGTMSDLNYDPAICRNIMVDIRYVLFIIDKYADAGHLIQEMKLVKGQKKHRRKK
ncbi:MAG: S46 family peptidase, partial [Bacteroidetes bacterium]|nr:S46 family peptidase [Bacteroidota bacterium]